MISLTSLFPLELEETPAADLSQRRFAEYVHSSLLRDGLKKTLEQYDKRTMSSRQAVDVFRSVAAQCGEGAARRQEELGLEEIGFGNILEIMNGQLEHEPEDNIKSRLAAYLSSSLRHNQMIKVLADYDKRVTGSRQTVVMFRSFLDLLTEDVDRHCEAMDLKGIGYDNVMDLMVGKRCRPTTMDDEDEDEDDSENGHDEDCAEPPSKRSKTSKEGGSPP